MPAPFKLPHLQRKDPIIEEDRTPSMAFHQWWQVVVTNIQNTINDIIDILVRLGAVEVLADGTLAFVQGTIAADNTIKDNKVLTGSIQDDAITQRYFTQIVSPVTLTDGVEVEITNVSVTKVRDDSDMDIDANLRLSSSDDIRGTIRIYRNTTLIDNFDPFMNGSGGSFRIPLTMPFTDVGPAAGTYTYKVTFQRNGGASAVVAAAGSLIRVKEFKR